MLRIQLMEEAQDQGSIAIEERLRIEVFHIYTQPFGCVDSHDYILVLVC